MWWKSVVNLSFFLSFAAFRMRPSACDTLLRLYVRHVLCCSAFPLVPALRSTGSATSAVLLADFIATMAGSNFSGPCIIGYCSSPSRCGPATAAPLRSDPRPPSFRCDPFARDVAPRQGNSTSLNGAAHVAFKRIEPSAPAISDPSWLNPIPHAIAVYASRPLSPVGTQHSLPIGPDFPAGSHQLAAGVLIQSLHRQSPKDYARW